MNAAVASFGFHWLVGESELRSQQVEVAPGVMREQRSVVHIKKCRYLESSGCVGLCTNMCKVRQACMEGLPRLHRQPPPVFLNSFRRASLHVLPKPCGTKHVISTVLLLAVVAMQIPTQSFFTSDFGLPLTMNPNFEDLSCDMVFGQTPPPLEQDPVYTQPCFVPQCSLAAGVEPCPKTDTDREKQRKRAAAAVAAASNGSSLASTV